MALEFALNLRSHSLREILWHAWIYLAVLNNTEAFYGLGKKDHSDSAGS